MWAVIGGRLGFVQFPGNESEPGRSGPGIAQQLQNTYDQYLQHFESAYVLTVRNRQMGASSQQPIHQMGPTPPAMGNNVAPGMSGNPTEVPLNSGQRPLANQQIVATALRFVLTSAQDMRASRVPEHMIAFVERHRADLLKLYQQQAQLAAKRNAEQEQQNVQGPLPNMQEQPPVGSQSSAPRPPQPVGANTMVGIADESKMGNGSFVPDSVAAALHRQPPTQDQIQYAITAIGQIKHLFQQRSELSWYFLCCHSRSVKVSLQ